MLKYGVVQGRLLPQVGDFIQNFPDDWEEEFKVAKRLGASHIELIDGAPNKPNWQWSKQLPIDVPVSAICADWMVYEGVNAARLRDLALTAERLGIGTIVLPFLEKASLRVRAAEGYDLIHAVVKEFPAISFSVETDLDAKPMSEFLYWAAGNVSITFDTGNLTRFGYSLNDHIGAYGLFVDNLHIKDVRGSTTVPLGMGDVDFKCLKRLMGFAGYKKIIWTFQTARNPGLSEEDTFRYNVETIERVLSEWDVEVKQ